jgi:hypothetical protein
MTALKQRRMSLCSWEMKSKVKGELYAGNTNKGETDGVCLLQNLPGQNGRISWTTGKNTEENTKEETQEAAALVTLRSSSVKLLSSMMKMKLYFYRVSEAYVQARWHLLRTDGYIWPSKTDPSDRCQCHLSWAQDPNPQEEHPCSTALLKVFSPVCLNVSVPGARCRYI